jgi:hypothetical protein
MSDEIKAAQLIAAGAITAVLVSKLPGGRPADEVIKERFRDMLKLVVEETPPMR